MWHSNDIRTFLGGKMAEPTTEMKIKVIEEILGELNEKFRRLDLTDNERKKVQEALIIF